MLQREIDPANTFIPMRGLNTAQNDLTIEQGMSPDLANVDLLRGGTIKKRAGYEPLASQGSWQPEQGNPDRIDGLLFLAQHVTGDLFLLVSVEGAVWIYSAATDTWEEGSGAFGEGRLRGATSYNDEGAESIYVTNGVSAPFIFDGADFTPWTAGEYGDGGEGTGTRGYPGRWEDPEGDGSVEDWPAALAVMGIGTANRMLAYGFDLDPCRIDYSEFEVPWNFLKSNVDDETASSGELDGGFFYCFKGDGDRIMWIGEFANRLIVMKRRRTFIYDGFVGGEDFNPSAILNVGTVSAESVFAVGNDLYFWSQDGPRKLSSVMETGDIRMTGFQAPVKDKISGATTVGLDRIFGYHDQGNQRVLWYYPEAGAASNSAALVYYYILDEWTWYNGSLCEANAGVAAPTTSMQSERIYLQMTNGVVAQAHSGVVDDEDEIEAHYVTRWMFHPGIGERGQIVMVDLIVGEGGRIGVELQVGWDYSPFYDDVDIKIGALGNKLAGVWGYSVWGGDDEGNTVPGIENPLVWGASGQGVFRYRVLGSGHLYRFRISSSEAAGFEIVGIQPTLTAKGKT